MIALIEYDTASKPTGRLCRVPDITREQLADLLPLYGFTGKLDTNTGIMNGYNAERWCFVYRSGMAWHPGTDTTLDALIV